LIHPCQYGVLDPPLSAWSVYVQLAHTGYIYRYFKLFGDSCRT